MTSCLAKDIHSLVKALETSPVSPTCWVVLSAVVAVPGLRPTDYVAKELPWMTKADLSGYLKQLEGASFVARSVHPADKRSFLYVPTKAGQEALRDFLLLTQGVAKGSGLLDAPAAF